MRCLLLGNYGVGNWGDEMLRYYFEERYSDVQWVVVSQSMQKPSDVPRLPLRPYQLFNRRWWRTLKGFYSCDAIVFGGGTLFTDTEGMSVVIMWFVYSFLAIIFRKPYALALQGVGPFRTRLGKHLSRWAFRHASFVSIRDELSVQRAREMSMRTPLVESFDPVLLLLRDVASPMREAGLIGVIPRDNSDQSFVEEGVRAVGTGKCSILLFKPNDSNERRIASLLKARIPNARICEIRTLNDAVREVGRCDRILSMRFHATLVAYALDTPVVVRSQIAFDKHEALEKMLRVSDVKTLTERAMDGEEALRSWFHSFSVH